MIHVILFVIFQPLLKLAMASGLLPGQTFKRGTKFVTECFVVAQYFRCLDTSTK